MPLLLLQSPPPMLLLLLLLLLLLRLLLLLLLPLRVASVPRWFCRALPIAKWRAGHPRSPRGVELMSKAEAPTDMRSASSWLFRDRRARFRVEVAEAEEEAAEEEAAEEARVGVEAAGVEAGEEAAGVGGSAALAAAAAMH